MLLKNNDIGIMCKLSFNCGFFAGAMPYDSLNVADIGDVAMRMYYTQYAAEDIREAYRTYIKDGCKTLTMGGDHTITYPILQAYKVSTQYHQHLHQARQNKNSVSGGAPG